MTGQLVLIWLVHLSVDFNCSNPQSRLSFAHKIRNLDEVLRLDPWLDIYGLVKFSKKNEGYVGAYRLSQYLADLVLMVLVVVLSLVFLTYLNNLPWHYCSSRACSAQFVSLVTAVLSGSVMYVSSAWIQTSGFMEGLCTLCVRLLSQLVPHHVDHVLMTIRYLFHMSRQPKWRFQDEKEKVEFIIWVMIAD